MLKPLRTVLLPFRRRLASSSQRTQQVEALQRQRDALTSHSRNVNTALLELQRQWGSGFPTERLLRKQLSELHAQRSRISQQIASLKKKSANTD